MIFEQLIADIKAIYYGLNGRNVLVGFSLFVLVYGFISYVGSSNTTSQLTNMGIPVGDYEGNYWASNIAIIAISVPLTIAIIWLFLHLIKVLFHIDLVEFIKRILGDHPVSDLIQTADEGIVKSEVKTANFLHTLKEKTQADIESSIKSYKKESFSSAAYEEYVGESHIQKSLRPQTPPINFNHRIIKEQQVPLEEHSSYSLDTQTPSAYTAHNDRLLNYENVEGAYNNNNSIFNQVN